MLKTLALSLSLAAATIGAAQESTSTRSTTSGRAAFHLEDATIADLQQAIVSGQITTVGLVELYLKRIKAYNGTCVRQPDGVLGAGPDHADQERASAQCLDDFEFATHQTADAGL